MLFNSHVFIFCFLPLVLLGYALICRCQPKRVAMAWLVVCSLIYYGWWRPIYVPLIVGSIALNYSVGYWLAQHRSKSASRLALALGIAANLAVLAYFKYANFFVESVNDFSGASLYLEEIVLPIGLSFFTFQQIAYLVDAYRGETREYHIVDYALFVTFFPQLIAGPIVHHKEMLPQFADRRRFRVTSRNMSVGLTIFFIGLAKKVLLADTAALYASPVFDAADAGQLIHWRDAWCGASAYTFQLYFDFSGYSDMAIGIARMFAIRLPINFNSPYKATSAIEFWRRWHITLSRFLRDYLYFPLGGNRRGPTRRYANLMITMVLGGLWHGAGWTFVFWGALHGAYLCVNHAWTHLRDRLGLNASEQKTMIWSATACVLTYLAVVVAWVFFRAKTFAGARAILLAMVGLAPPATAKPLVTGSEVVLVLAAMQIVVWFLPNTQEFMRRFRPALYCDHLRSLRDVWLNRVLQWRPNWQWAAIMAIVSTVSVLCMTRTSEFIYYQF